MAEAFGFESLTLEDFEEPEIRNLTNPETMKYLSASGTKIMIIMRGVSGAGKSTIVKHLRKKFSTDCVCSADDYFMVGGVYRFDRRHLSAAHEHSHRLASDFCEQRKPVVIIDNTNVKEWETTFYVGVARSNGYVVYMITPAFQFKANARVLAKRSTHGVDANFIEEKLKIFSEITPRYFAWFFSESDSNKLRKMRDAALTRFRKHDHFQFTSVSETKIGSEAKSESEAKKNLHLTSVFLGKVPDGRDKKLLISKLNKELGKVDEVKVVAVIVTKRTVSARVALGGGAIGRYHNDDFCLGDEHSRKPGYERLPKYHAAHITLDTSLGTTAAEARTDTILSHLCEVNNADSRHEEGITYYLQEKIALINLHRPLALSGIFAGYY